MFSIILINVHICCYFNKKLSEKNINSTKECVFSGEHPPYNLSREEGASGVDNSTRHHIDVNSPAAGLVLLSTTVFILFLAGGCWTLLCIFRPELIQSLGLFLTGGLTVSEILSYRSYYELTAFCCHDSKNIYR